MDFAFEYPSFLCIFFFFLSLACSMWYLLLSVFFFCTCRHRTLFTLKNITKSSIFIQCRSTITHSNGSENERVFFHKVLKAKNIDLFEFVNSHTMFSHAFLCVAVVVHFVIFAWNSNSIKKYHRIKCIKSLKKSVHSCCISFQLNFHNNEKNKPITGANLLQRHSINSLLEQQDLIWSPNIDGKYSLFMSFEARFFFGFR